VEVPVLVVRPVSGSAPDAVLDALWQCDPLAVWERDDGALLASFADAATLAEAHDTLAKRVDVAIEHHDDGLDAWRAHATVTRVDDTVVIRPSWVPYEPGPGELVIDIEPGRAFGSGAHATTVLCARRLVALVRPGDRVLDVGCGSGILSIVAALLGSDAIGVEIDLESFANARENVAVNAVEHRVRLVEGSADVIEGRFPVVVANILAVTLIEIADQIRARATGELVLAGLMLPDVDRVVAAYPDFMLVDRLDDGEWAILRLRRQASSTP